MGLISRIIARRGFAGWMALVLSISIAITVPTLIMIDAKTKELLATLEAGDKRIDAAFQEVRLALDELHKSITDTKAEIQEGSL